MTDRLGLAFALLVLGAGCNQVYGLDQTQLMPIEAGVIIGEDLDLDGIPDEFDDCIAPMRDAADDYDADGAPAATDLCPFDPDPVVDVDQDGLPDACDPFPKAGGDRRRCYMSFGSTDLNARLWKARDATNEWTSREGELFTKTPGATSGLVSTIELEAAAQTTFDAAVTLSNASAGTYAFRVWARAADAFDNQELGCELSGDPTSTRFAVVRGNDMDVPGGATTVFLPFPRSVPVRVRLTLAASGTGVDIRCAFAWAAVEGVVKARVDGMAPGRVAFGTENLQAAVSALAIYERGRVEPLP